MSDDTENPGDENPESGSEWDDALKEQGDGEAGAEEDPWAAAMDEQEVSEAENGKAGKEKPPESPPAAQPASIDELPASGLQTRDSDVNINAILDVPLTIGLEVGKTEISIRNLLQLNEGSVVELDRIAGDPLDVTVNGTLIAHGEVVVVNDKFGIRLTDIISPAERIRNLE